jgi:hypothetical protein
MIKVEESIDAGKLRMKPEVGLADAPTGACVLRLCHWQVLAARSRPASAV